MSCSKPNLMVFDGYSWNFRGPRFQENQYQDLAYGLDSVEIPCGKCQLCLVDRRYSNALRIMLEAESWPGKTYFITLTFDENHVGSGELDHQEWSQFIKNFRRRFCQAQYTDIRKRADYYGKIRSVTFKEIKQVMCGEYGDTFGRKHFHGIIFNHSFDDVEFTGHYSKKGNPIYTSKSLQEVWKKGFVQVEEVTFDLALYVGSYVTDKLDDPEAHHGHSKKQYGRFGRGIGLSWISKYWRDVLVSGRVKLLDREFPVPRYFAKKIRDMRPEEYERYKQKKLLRLAKARKKNIEKGDGPLRRARAKGEIFHHQQTKRRLNGNGKGACSPRKFQDIPV